ncbi:MAG TPA: glycerate kinase [Bacteroidales bacterium]|nr:glycerate kinase [Bacteroidales bacterium]
MNNRDLARKIFMEGVKSVLPEKLITGSLSLQGSILWAGDHQVDLRGKRNIYVIGAGKASGAMGHYVETVLGDRISGGHIVVKYGYACKLRKITVTEAGHPVPDSNSFMAADAIAGIARQAEKDDLVICLISGGGSALLTDLPGGLLPEEIHIVNNLLTRCGATIREINTVRKHLSGIKGGQLAAMVYPAALITLIISDVIGDAPDVIASGPTVPDASTYDDAFQVIEKYGLASDLTAGIMKYLNDGRIGLRSETPKPGDPLFSDQVIFLCGTNRIALEAAKNYAELAGLESYIADDSLQGDVELAAEVIFNAAADCRANRTPGKPACLIFGGETTVRVSGEGLGGRNQHLALSLAMRLRDKPGITILAAGTDGTDGPTDMAGAVVDSETIVQAEKQKIDPEKYLAAFDSYNFFKKTGGHIRTGPTFTNVMDMAIVLVE